MLSAFPPSISIVFLAAILLFTAVGATPLPGDLEVAGRDLEARAVSPLSPEDIASFAPFTQFARAAYCPGTQDWTCGGKLNLFLICDRDRCLGGWGTVSLFPSLQKRAALFLNSNLV